MGWLAALLLLLPPCPAASNTDQCGEGCAAERREPPGSPPARCAVLHLHLLHEPRAADLVRDDRRVRVRFPQAARVKTLADELGHDLLRAP